jgi:hypothetical protein
MMFVVIHSQKKKESQFTITSACWHRHQTCRKQCPHYLKSEGPDRQDGKVIYNIISRKTIHAGPDKDPNGIFGQKKKKRMALIQIVKYMRKIPKKPIQMVK